MRPDESADALRTSHFWDALAIGEVPSIEDTGPHADLITRLHRQDDAPQVNAAFAYSLGARLMPAAGIRHSASAGTTPTSPPPAKGDSMHPHLANTGLPTLNRDSSRPRTRRAPSVPVRFSAWFPTASIVVVVVMVMSTVFGGDINRFLDDRDPDRAQLAALDDSTPESSDATPNTSAPDASGGTYRGTAARDRVNPGPGPTGNAVLAWEFTPDEPDHVRSVVVSGNRAFAVQSSYAGESGDDTTSLNCLNISDGSPCWNRPYEFGESEDASDPTVSGDLVYVTLDNSVYAIDARTGAKLWQRSLNGPVSTLSPTVAEGVVVTTVTQHVVVALDALNGENVWKAGLPEAVVEGTDGDSSIAFNATPAVADGRVFVKTSVGWVVAYDLATGSVAWTFDSGAGRTMDTSGLPVSVSDGVASFTAAQDDGDDATTNVVKLFALDSATGKEIWPAIDVPGTGNLAVADGMIYLAPHRNQPAPLTAIDAATGETRWTRDGVTGWGPPVIVDDLVYVATSGRIDALVAATGDPTWSVYVGDAHLLSVSNNLALVARGQTLLAVGGDGSAFPSGDVVDLSGLPECNLPRDVPMTELTGEPALTIPVETRLVEQVGTVYDDSGNIATDQQSPYPQILVQNMPPLEDADPATVSEIRDTVLMHAGCMPRPDFRATGQPAFYSDDFLRRGFYEFTPGLGYRIYWPLIGGALDEEDFDANYRVSILADGRIAVTVGNVLGAFIIYTNVDGVWLIDEFYEIRREYNDGSQG